MKRPFFLLLSLLLCTCVSAQEFTRFVYLGEDDKKYVFGMIQVDADTHRDHISYPGNEEIGAENSPDGMIVAGFGRDEGAKPSLSGKHTFYVALLPKKKPNKVRKQLRKLLRK